MKNKKIIDLHCDTLLQLRDNKKSELRENNFHVDLKKMKSGGVFASTFAMFVELNLEKKPFHAASVLHDIFLRELQKNESIIEQIICKEDLLRIEKNGKLGAILSCEEGEIIEGNLDNLQVLKDWGVRAYTFTWNFENSLAYPNSDDSLKMKKGLKPLGIEALSEMERLNIIADVSHLSDGGFYDVAKYCTKPFMATHSNSREICNHGRNLTDEMIKILANSGGIMGLNFYPPFLDSKNNISSIESMVKHIEHIYNVGGEAVLALGSDFDGIEGNLEIDDISKLPNLYSALEKSFIPPSVLPKMFNQNAKRVLFNM